MTKQEHGIWANFYVLYLYIHLYFQTWLRTLTYSLGKEGIGKGENYEKLHELFIQIWAAFNHKLKIGYEPSCNV